MNLPYKGVLAGMAIVLIPALLMGNTQYEVQKQNVYEFHMTNAIDKNAQGFLLNTVTGDTWYLNTDSRDRIRYFKVINSF
jgi:hypothetical protein|tara:strand:+ start:3728 stop:3967 length:240 start_codon:yes stop_codon:yes gene_type:complete